MVSKEASYVTVMPLCLLIINVMCKMCIVLLSVPARGVVARGFSMFAPELAVARSFSTLWVMCEPE